MALMWSSVLEMENERNLDPGRRAAVRKLSAGFQHGALPAEDVMARGRELTDWGFSAVDAMHVACAELLQADYFLTVDDSLLDIARQKKDSITTRILNPIVFAQELRNEE